jgi:hypothetical protein
MKLAESVRVVTTGETASTRSIEQDHLASYFRASVFLLICIALGCQSLLAQKQASSLGQKLPSAEKIVEKYLKAVGGKKRLAAIRDATCDWEIQLYDQTIGVAKTQSAAPASARSQMTFGNGQIISAANASSAWSRGLDGELRTLTDSEGGAAKLQAVLDASHLVDYKKSNVAARVISIGDVSSEPAFMVEFSTRSSAKIVYYFSRSTGLLTRIDDGPRKTTTRLSDYRAEDGVLQPHRVGIDLRGSGQLTLLLRQVSYNVGISSSVFDPPRATESVDLPALLRQVARNQDEVEKRFSEYSLMQKETDREIDNRGQVKKETVKTFEVFPVANSAPILKLIGENGMPLSGERAAKEEKRVEDEFLKAERDRDKNEQKEQRRRAERERKKAARGNEDDDVEISQFLKVCEFVSPRHERFRDRDAIVFDFRSRPGFKPSNRQEDLISKLVGVVWVDPADQQVMRLEARLAEGFKIAGGLLFSLRPGAALVMEQTRMEEGIWLPRLAQINLSVKVLLFGGAEVNKTIEWSDYKHYKSDVGDYKLDAPKTGDARDKRP